MLDITHRLEYHWYPRRLAVPKPVAVRALNSRRESRIRDGSDPPLLAAQRGGQRSYVWTMSRTGHLLIPETRRVKCGYLANRVWCKAKPWGVEKGRRHKRRSPYVRDRNQLLQLYLSAGSWRHHSATTIRASLSSSSRASHTLQAAKVQAPSICMEQERSSAWRRHWTVRAPESCAVDAHIRWFR